MFRAFKRVFGRALNALGAPGFIRASQCHNRVGVPVEVRVDDMFTIVSVKNLRLLFHRLTGQFDGVIVDSKDCRVDPPRSSPGSTRG